MPEIETAIQIVETSEDYGRFVIEPLEKGFGATLGNAMRRMLLGALPGAAVTTAKLEGVYHEFTAIPHIKEDMTEFLLNVKEIRLRSFSDRPAVKMRLEVSGEGRVCAGDIVVPPDVEVVNPELHLITLDSPEARLAVEFGVEHGKGYLPADHRSDLPIGTIPVDAIFTPMRKVNYQVEPTRVKERTDLERLVLEVWTDGTITPRQAVSQAARILNDHLKLFLELERQPARADKHGLSAVPISVKDYERSIEELDLSVRAYNCLKRSGITKVGQVLEMSDEELLAVRNFGQKSMEELKERLAQRGFLLRGPGEEGQLEEPTEGQLEEPTEGQLEEPTQVEEELGAPALQTYQPDGEEQPAAEEQLAAASDQEKEDET